MKIAHITPAFFSDASMIGGGERYVGNVVSAIKAAQLKYDLSLTQEVFCISSSSSIQDIGGVRHNFLRNESPSSHPMSAVSDALWSELKEFDLIHVYQGITYFGAFVGLVVKDLKKKLVFTDLGGGENQLMLNHGGICIADGVVSISKFASDLLGSVYKGPQAVILGPIDTQFFSQNFNYSRKARSLLCVGRILPHKGIDRIIRALPDGFSLTVVGRPYNKEYFNLLTELSFQKDVSFKTTVTDRELVDLYAQASLFVHAATHMDCYGNSIRNPELMGLSTLEALACGVPVSVSNAASLPELAPVGSYFRIFNDEDELKQQIIELGDGKWGDASAQSQASIFAKINYSLEVVGKKYFDFYKSV